MPINQVGKSKHYHLPGDRDTPHPHNTSSLQGPQEEQRENPWITPVTACRLTVSSGWGSRHLRSQPNRSKSSISSEEEALCQQTDPSLSKAWRWWEVWTKEDGNISSLGRNQAAKLTSIGEMRSIIRYDQVLRGKGHSLPHVMNALMKLGTHVLMIDGKVGESQGWGTALGWNPTSRLRWEIPSWRCQRCHQHAQAELLWALHMLFECNCYPASGGLNHIWPLEGDVFAPTPPLPLHHSHFLYH